MENAAGLGHKALVELPISKDADMSAKNHLGQTPFRYAVREGHNEFIKLLVDNGAGINFPTDEARIPCRDVGRFQNKETPIDWAIEQQQTSDHRSPSQTRRQDQEGTGSCWQLNQPAPPLERSGQMKHLLITTIEE